MALEKRRLGRTDIDATVLGFGGSEIGYQNASRETAGRLLEAALNHGLNVIDTAACYDDSEELVSTVAHRRSDYWLFSKCGHAVGLPTPDWDPRTVEQSIDRSLRRLQTDHLDLIQLHSCSEAVLRRGDVIEAVQRAKAAGKARYIGYSGDGRNALYAVRSGVFDTLQTSVNIADQEAIELTIPEAVAAGMGVIAKRPIANAAWRHGRRPADSYQHAYWERLQKLQYDFLSADVEAAVAIALRFTLSVSGVHVAIVGTQNPDRWAQNSAYVSMGQLPVAQYEAIRARWREVAQPDWTGRT